MFIEEYQDKHGNTKYRFVERYTDPLTNKRKQVSVTMNKNGRQSQKEAQKRLTALIDKRLKETDNKDLKTLTFHEACDEWFEHYKKTSGSKITTLSTYSANLNSVKSNFDKDLLITKMTASFIQKKLNNWNKELSSSQLVVRKNFIRTVFKYVKSYYGLKDISFLDDLTVPRKAKTINEVQAKKNNYLEQSELNELLEAFDKDITTRRNVLRKYAIQRVKDIVEIQALNGMRIGELLALKHEDIDINNKKMSIVGTIVWKRDNNTGVYGIKDTTKTATSYRTIDLSNRSCEILRRVMLENKQSAQWNKEYNHQGFIFTNYAGSPMHLLKVNEILGEIVDNTSFKTKRVTTHTLRHTHISNLAQLGIPLKAIMERVGHSSEKTTLSVYMHVTEQMNKDLINKLNDLEKNKVV